MATGPRNRPAPEVEESLRQRAWGANDLAGELYVARRRFDSSLRDQVVDYPSLEDRRSGSPALSLHRANFSTIQAARPTGESVSA